MQRDKPFSSYIVAALFISLSLTTGCSRNHTKSTQQEQVSIEAEAQLDVPLIRQSGTRNNCGPTAAAMVLAAYRGIEEEDDLRELRNTLGEWSFEQFAMRRLKLPGIRGGMTPESVLIGTMNHYGDGIEFNPLDPHIGYQRKTLSPNAQAERALKHLNDAIVTGKPVLALVQSGLLWPRSSESLHWVVVTGISEKQIVINDPADGSVNVFTVQEFLRGWRLNPFFRTLPFIHSYSAIVGDKPLTSIDSDKTQDLVLYEDNALTTASANAVSWPANSVLK